MGHAIIVLSGNWERDRAEIVHVNQERQSPLKFCQEVRGVSRQEELLGGDLSRLSHIVSHLGRASPPLIT